MQSLYHAGGIGDSPRWAGSVPYIKAEAAEVGQRYQREDAEPLSPEGPETAPRPPNRRRPVLLAVAVLVGAFAVGSFTAVNLFPAQAIVTPAAGAGATAWSGPLGRLDDRAAGAGATAWSGALGRLDDRAAGAGALAWSGPLGRLDDRAGIAGAGATAWSGLLGR